MKRFKKTFFILSSCLLLFLLVNLATISGLSANWKTVGSNFAVNSSTHGQDHPSIAYNLNLNHYMVVWHEDRDLHGDDVYARLVNPSGVPIGSEISVSSAEDGQNKPAVAYSPSSLVYLVVWEDDRGIYGQRVNVNGQLVGGEIEICSSSYDLIHPEVAYSDYSNKFLVIWEDKRDGGPDSDIYGAFVGADGSVGSDFAVSRKSNKETEPMSVAYNSYSKQFLVVWEDSDEDVYGQLVEANGELAGSLIPVAIADNDQNEPSVAADPYSKQFLVVWHHNISGDQFINQGQRVNTNGALSGLPITISSASSLRPSITYCEKTKQFMVVWQTWTGSETNLSARAVNANGTLANEVAVSTANGWQSATSLAQSSLTGRVLTVWRDSRGPEANIYGQLLAPSPVKTRINLSAKPRSIKRGRKVTVYGKLVDNLGKAVAGKYIVIKANGKKIKRVKTNSKGKFSLTHRPRKTTIYKAYFSTSGLYSACSSKLVRVKVRRR